MKLSQFANIRLKSPIREGGCGIDSGKGKTYGNGDKGHGSEVVLKGFESRQIPFYRRISEEMQ